MDEQTTEWRETKFWRAMLSFYLFGGVIGISNEFFGRAGDQPWWGVALTLLVAGSVAAGAWHDVRTFERRG